MYDGDKGKNRSNNPVARLICVRGNVPPQPNSIIIIKVRHKTVSAPGRHEALSTPVCCGREKIWCVCVFEKRSRMVKIEDQLIVDIKVRNRRGVPMEARQLPNTIDSFVKVYVSPNRERCPCKVRTYSKPSAANVINEISSFIGHQEGHGVLGCSGCCVPSFLQWNYYPR